MKPKSQKQKSDSRFVYKLSNGYLVGREYPKAPCKKCIGMWLTERKVSNTLVDVSELSLCTEVFNSVELGVLYEIADDGTPTRLECELEKHPDCTCKGQTIRYANSQKLNFAFSAIRQMKVARYTTPSGNLFVCNSTHRDGTTKSAVDTSREAARLASVKAVYDSVANTPSKLEILKSDIVFRYTNQCKTPMLIVGVNNWMRTHLPYFILQQFDVHLFFYPNAKASWVCGALAINRTNPKAISVWSYGASQNIETALKQAMYGLLEKAQTENVEEQNEKLGVWQSQWVYRCPKISLKDVLHLEPYPADSLDEYKPSKTQAMPTKSVFRLVLGGQHESMRKAG
jgi:hypothetical protein